MAALRDRGVAEHALGEFEQADPEIVLATCAWFDRQRGRIRVGAFLIELRSRLERRSTGSLLDAQQDYGEQIRDWLIAKLPDVCKPNPKVVEWERRLYGEDAARRLAESGEPHPAAIAAVIRLHARDGRGTLTVGEHGAAVRAAVRAHDQEAVRDYELIAGKREREAALDEAALATTRKGT